LVGIGTAKALGTRPKRNRQKRRVRELFRLLPDCTSGKDWVVIAKASVAEASHQELQDEVNTLIQKLEKRWDESSASS